ncbi:CBS domain-containing protein [Salinibaculum salinum]|uniref:CBS domain-containing protein n=1 Tax=Salinibaculum salinum TaxID=3131996 RepID=UPI0030ED798C
MPVEELARTDPIAATRQASITQVAALMRDEDVGSVVIVEDDEPVGIVTDRDVTVKVTAEGNDPTDVTAEEVMTPDPVVVDSDTGVMELTHFMADNAVRRVPVVDDGKLDGIITLDDLDQLLSDERQNLAKVVEAESPPY